MEITVRENESFAIKAFDIDAETNGKANFILNGVPFGSCEFEYDLAEFFRQILNGLDYDGFDVNILFSVTCDRFKELFDCAYVNEFAPSKIVDMQLKEFCQKIDSIVFTYGDYGLDKCLVGFLQKGDLERLLMIDSSAGLSESANLQKGQFKRMVAKMLLLLENVE